MAKAEKIYYWRGKSTSIPTDIITGRILVADDTGNAYLDYADYQDGRLKRKQLTDTSKANIAGQTFTGPVILYADPTEDLEAATKQYVDDNDDSIKSTLNEHTSDEVIHIKAAERTSWNNKVDKVPGKQLSTEDYTTEEKNKLSNITEGATKTSYQVTQSSGVELGKIKINDTTYTIYAPIVTDIDGNAASATKLKTSRTIDGVSFDGTSNINHYGVCSSAASTKAKVVSVTGFNRAVGSLVYVLFNNANTAVEPTLNVSGTGAYPITYRGNLLGNTSYDKLTAGLQSFVFTGTEYALLTSFDTVATDIPGNAATATALKDARNIDGVLFNGTADINHYGTCTSAAGTAAKVASVTGYNLVTGGVVYINFSNTNSVNNPTLNISNTGAYPIKYRGQAIADDLVDGLTNGLQCLLFTGSSYELLSCIDKIPYDIEGNAGTATALQTPRTIDGVTFSGTSNITRYSTCSTAGNTAAKTTTVANVDALSNGLVLNIHFSEENSVASPTLKVNNLDAKPINYNRLPLTEDNASYLRNGLNTLLYYNGGFEIINVDRDTTYGVATHEVSGLMSNEDKAQFDAMSTKLAGIEDNANNYVLPKADFDSFGGVSVGNNITVIDGNISLTSDDVVNALGYTPAGSEELSDFTGATEDTFGAHGLVPAPRAGEQGRFLKGDGTWATMESSTFTGATPTKPGKAGLVPGPPAGKLEAVLASTGGWRDISAFLFPIPDVIIDDISSGHWTPELNDLYYQLVYDYSYYDINFFPAKTFIKIDTSQVITIQPDEGYSLPLVLNNWYAIWIPKTVGATTYEYLLFQAPETVTFTESKSGIDIEEWYTGFFIWGRTAGHPYDDTKYTTSAAARAAGDAWVAALPWDVYEQSDVTWSGTDTGSWAGNYSYKTWNEQYERWERTNTSIHVWPETERQETPWHINGGELKFNRSTNVLTFSKDGIPDVTTTPIIVQLRS